MPSDRLAHIPQLEVKDPDSGTLAKRDLNMCTGSLCEFVLDEYSCREVYDFSALDITAAS